MAQHFGGCWLTRLAVHLAHLPRLAPWTPNQWGKGGSPTVWAQASRPDFHFSPTLGLPAPAAPAAEGAAAAEAAGVPGGGRGGGRGRGVRGRAGGGRGAAGEALVAAGGEGTAAAVDAGRDGGWAVQLAAALPHLTSLSLHLDASDEVCMPLSAACPVLQPHLLGQSPHFCGNWPVQIAQPGMVSSADAQCSSCSTVPLQLSRNQLNASHIHRSARRTRYSVPWALA